MFTTQENKELKEELQNSRFFGEAGAGLVVVTINGIYEILDIKIDDSIIESSKIENRGDLSFISDLVKVATNQAVVKATQNAGEIVLNKLSQYKQNVAPGNNKFYN